MTSSRIRQAKVAELLKAHGVKSPPVPVERIAKGLGLRLQRGPLPDELSGFLYNEKTRKKPIVGVNSLHAPVRQRFTIAHEIGHFLWHKGSEVYVDRDFSIHFRDQKSSRAEVVDEIEANRFAAELLMPEDFIRQDLARKSVDLGKETLLLELAERYRVSLQALVIRLTRLGYLPA